MGQKRYSVSDKESLWDEKISFYVVFYFFASIANATIKTVFPIPDSIWSLLSAGWGALIVFFMLRCYGEVLRRSGKLFGTSVAVFGIIYVISLLLIISRGEPAQGFWRGQVFISYAYWIPIGVAVASVRNKQILYDTFYRWSYIMSLLLFACVFFRRSTELMEGETEYNMFFGFHLVIPALFHISEYYRTRKKAILAFFILEVMLLIIYANRGSLIPIVFYFVFRIMLSNNADSQKKMAYIMMVGLVTMIIVIFANPIFSFLEEVSTAIGIRSRTLSLMASGEMADPTGRDELSKIAWRMIWDSPAVGWGLGGEFYEISRQLGQFKAGVSNAAFTPHNGVLEFLISFGLLGGTLASLLFIVPFFKLGSVKDPYTALMVLIFGCAVVAPSLLTADGLTIKPGAAIFIYLYYTRTKYRHFT